jgi:hypothetical protein
MIECSECSAQISNKAKVCIKCGAPVALPLDVNGSEATPTRVVTVEQTGKKYKAMVLVGGAMILAGGVSCSLQQGEITGALAGGLFLLGIIIFVGARMGAWWDHE